MLICSAGSPTPPLPGCHPSFPVHTHSTHTAAADTQFPFLGRVGTRSIATDQVTKFAELTCSEHLHVCKVLLLAS